MSEKLKIDFIGVGTAKSGTTWLSSYLSKHPQVNFVPHKEIQFFNKKGEIYDMRPSWPYTKGIEWYESQFLKPEPRQITGEFSPQYMADPEAAELIYKHYPDVKILICLREPVSRSYSHFWMFKGAFAFEKAKTFEEIVENNAEYLTRSLYYPQLIKYFELFPRENIYIALYEEIKEDPSRVLKEVCKFLDIDTVPVANLLKKIDKNETKVVKSVLLSKILYIPSYIRTTNLSKYFIYIENSKLYRYLKYLYKRFNMTSSQYPQMLPETRKRLKSYFRDDIIKTQELIGKDLSKWLED